MNSQQWIEKADKYIIKTYGSYPLVPVKGEGCYLWDADGKRYLDFLAGVAVNNLGHCHPRVVEALQKQAGELIHCSNFYHIPHQIELAELLCTHSFADGPSSATAAPKPTKRPSSWPASTAARNTARNGSRS